MSDGKHTDAAMPARSMSAMRASMSQQPRRISSKLAASIDHSCLGRPITALRPMLGYTLPSYSQTCRPSSWVMIRGARSASAAGIRPSKRSGGSMRWSSTETIRWWIVGSAGLVGSGAVVVTGGLRLGT
jgi:hypothetical protein